MIYVHINFHEDWFTHSEVHGGIHRHTDRMESEKSTLGMYVKKKNEIRQILVIKIKNIVRCHLSSQPMQRSLLGNTFVNIQQYCRRC
jgi:hypothetical protein